MLRYYDYILEKAKEKFGDVRSQVAREWIDGQVITPYRVIARALGKPIPVEFRTVEIFGRYVGVMIDEEHRYRILKAAKELFPKDYELLRAVLIFLYETGSRAEALMKFEYIVQKVADMDIIYVKTVEKGKYKKLTWMKPISPAWFQYIKSLRPLTRSQLDSIRAKLKKVYERALEDLRGTLTYEYALSHPLHIWRHTRCQELLWFTNWNTRLVAKLTGWSNERNLVKFYGDIDPSVVAKMVGYDIELKPIKEPHFLTNALLEKAKSEGLL